MGFGLPAAIGAKIGAPHKMVVDIDGDASFSMTCQELLTAVEYNVPIKVLVLNNHCQGMVRQWQDLFYSERHSMTSMHSASSPAAATPEARAHRAAAADPCFKGLAEGMGAKGLACSSADDLESTMVGRAGMGACRQRRGLTRATGRIPGVRRRPHRDGCGVHAGRARLPHGSRRQDAG